MLNPNPNPNPNPASTAAFYRFLHPQIRTSAHLHLPEACTQAMAMKQAMKQAMAKSGPQLQLQLYNMRRLEGDIDDN